MPLAAVYNRTDQNWGNIPPSTTLTPTKAVSPAQGIVPSALTGDSRAGVANPASVLGTGANTDLVTNSPEAI